MKKANPTPERDLAARLVSSLLMLRTSRATLRKLANNAIASVGTARNVVQCVTDFLTWRTAAEISLIEPVTRSELEAYLTHESFRWRQKTVDQHRQALSLVFCVTLMDVGAGIATHTRGRAYSATEMERIAVRQSGHNALSTRIAFHSGLRASELIELRIADEFPAADRPWRGDLFRGLNDGVLYGTTGKGGLARRVWIPADLHDQLQARRRTAPRYITDRGVVRSAFFDIGGGLALSQSFSDASQRALGFSLGLHGLRHAYVQNRLETLLSLGVAPIDALEIISQEVGHLRPDITTAYLVGRC
ncbi:site-specific integrase [Pandoraea pnomenusa]|uniref:site-specific integrase n=1 Tax=Pandoraea pnomenusa TaxID=93220 RepID=UPI0011468DE4|nr:site-specific integrase [Pandoraea pnomenusa]QDH60184.1 site-specific integrase [Pandoraea pnomenusa]